MTLEQHKAAVDRAMRLSCWNAPQNPRILEGGITNVNLLVNDEGRDYVVPDDVKSVAVSIVAHRLILRPEFENLSKQEVVRSLLAATPIPIG